MPIPIIDLFAGPGGLGEGFSSLHDACGRRSFQIKLSIEKDEHAHRTLELRAFFRNFPVGGAPEEYYDYLRKRLSREQLFQKFAAQSAAAAQEAWHATLGTPQLPKRQIDDRIRAALAGATDWLLIGGPPCQAYSLVGRSRVIGKAGGQKKYDSDPRHTLYRQYLRILAEHRPPIFVMENVKGLLSAKRREEHTFERMLADLKRPGAWARGDCEDPNLEYQLLSFVKKIKADPHAPEDFVVHSENYGIPQTRHRIIILGIRSDIQQRHRLLVTQEQKNVMESIDDLPRVRSGISKGDDSPQLWQEAIREMLQTQWFQNGELDREVREALISASRRVGGTLSRGGEFLFGAAAPGCHAEWFRDERLKGFCNHSSRGHIRSDLHRYFFAAVFARETKRSPLLEDFPALLLPAHKNVQAALKETKFNDRFRVQQRDRPSTTIVSHIAKDGHYFIHYDPSQCRSLTVREVARLQTFPDNYFFEGPRTQQYQQVGNAVPPLLAYKIADVVADLFRRIQSVKTDEPL